MEKFYFTFGYGHADANNVPMDDHYTMVKAENYSEARSKMMKVWGGVWAFQYDQEHWNLSRKAPYSIPLTYVPFPPSQHRKDDDEET